MNLGDRVDVLLAGVVIGTATRTQHGLELTLFADARPSSARPASNGSSSNGASSNGSGPTVFPNYGKRKGAPIVGATMEDLEFYANGCRRTLNDPAKSRWHDKERELLAAIEAEIVRQGGTPGPKPRPRPNFDEGPQPTMFDDDPGFGPPPPGYDEDIAF